MEKDYYISLIYKQLKGEIAPDENRQLNQFLEEHPENEELYVDMKLSWELSDQSLNLEGLDVDGDLASLTKRLPKKAPKVVPIKAAKVVSFRRNLLRIAAAFLVFAVGTYLIRDYISTPTSSEQVLFAANDNLSFELPDGSKGELKKGSTLKYKIPFLENRITTLEGIAEFKVQRDENHPFQIYVNKGVVEVLGTQFTVNHQNEQITVSVTSGKVSLTQNEQSVLLESGQVGTCASYSDIPTKQDISTRNFNYWKRNQFRFENESLAAISNQLALIYGIKVSILNASMKNCPVVGVFNGDNPQKILQAIADKFSMKLSETAPNSFSLDEGICN